MSQVVTDTFRVQIHILYIIRACISEWPLLFRRYSALLLDFRTTSVSTGLCPGIYYAGSYTVYSTRLVGSRLINNSPGFCSSLHLLLFKGIAR